MIDIDIQLAVVEGRRRFDLRVRFATPAPFVALYGPSGAGKSLTLQAMAGLLRPSHGHIRIGGRTLYDAAAGVDLPAPERRVGYLFQHYALFPQLSVQDNVAFGLRSWWKRRLSAEDQAQVAGLLQSFGLAELAHARPAALSGGQQQRVALARALACRPQVLLLDEPFAALNPMLRHSLRQELAALRQRWDIPVVMVSHDIDDVLALADLALVYEQGQVVREVDLHTGLSRAPLQQLLGGPPVAEETPLRGRLRRLLGSGEPQA